MNETILEKLMAALPKVEAGATEVIELASAIKNAAQEAGAWTESHENVLQAAVAAVSTPQNSSPSPAPKVAALIGIAILGLSMLTGCAYMKSNTHSVSHVTTNGVEIVEQDTHSRAWTFFDANSALAKFRNGSDKTTLGTNVISPGTYASGVNESSSSTNLLNGVSQITAAAVSAFVQSAK